MPLRSDWSGRRCPIARSLDVVGDPWVVLVLREALMGRTRFDDFRRALGCADSVLSRRLSGLVDAGLLERRRYKDTVEARHEYVLTEAGADLLPVVQALALWGEKHTAAPGPGRLEVLHDVCGRTSDDPSTCSACGTRLTPATTSWVRPWRDEPVTPLVR